MTAVTRRPRPVAAVLAVAFALLAGLLAPARPVAAAGSLNGAKAKAAELRRRVAQLERQTALAIAGYDTVYARLGSVASARAAAEQELAAANAALVDRGEVADDRVRAVYMSGGSVALYASLLDSSDLHDAFARYANISALVGGDRVNVDDAAANVRRAAAAEARMRSMAQQQIRLERHAAEQAFRVEQLLAETQALLSSADAEVRRLVEEARLAAERAAAARFLAAAQTGPYSPPVNGRYACPVGTIRSFVDTWGAPRSGGRRHQGTDVFAPHGSPAYAVTDGVIDRWSTNALGGITLYLRNDQGDEYYYAHNARNIVPAGTRVRAGQVIALVGNTGNAATTPPHIHFEVHPGGGAPVNPYPFLKGICG